MLRRVYETAQAAELVASTSSPAQKRISLMELRRIFQRIARQQLGGDGDDRDAFCRICVKQKKSEAHLEKGRAARALAAPRV